MSRIINDSGGLNDRLNGCLIHSLAYDFYIGTHEEVLKYPLTLFLNCLITRIIKVFCQSGKFLIVLASIEYQKQQI